MVPCFVLGVLPEVECRNEFPDVNSSHTALAPLIIILFIEKAD